MSKECSFLNRLTKIKLDLIKNFIKTNKSDSDYYFIIQA